MLLLAQFGGASGELAADLRYVVTILLSGYQSFGTLQCAILQLNPALNEVELKTTLADYNEFLGSSIERETLEFISEGMSSIHNCRSRQVLYTYQNLAIQSFVKFGV